MVSIILNFTTSLLIYNLAYLQTQYSIQMISKASPKGIWRNKLDLSV